MNPIELVLRLVAFTVTGILALALIIAGGAFGYGITFGIASVWTGASEFSDLGIVGMIVVISGSAWFAYFAYSIMMSIIKHPSNNPIDILLSIVGVSRK